MNSSRQTLPKKPAVSASTPSAQQSRARPVVSAPVSAQQNATGTRSSSSVLAPAPSASSVRTNQSSGNTQSRNTGTHTPTSRATVTPPTTSSSLSRSATKALPPLPHQVQQNEAKDTAARRMSVSSSVSRKTQSTNNDWDSDSDSSTAWGESDDEVAPPVQPKPAPKRNIHPDSTVLQLTWLEKGKKGPGIAKAYIESQFGTKIEATPLDNNRIHFDSKSKEWELMVASLREHGLNIATSRFGDMEDASNKEKGERPIKIGGIFRIPELERDEHGEPIFERNGPAPPKFEKSSYKEPGEIWYISTREDRAYHYADTEKRNAHLKAQSEAKKAPGGSSSRVTGKP